MSRGTIAAWAILAIITAAITIGDITVKTRNEKTLQAITECQDQIERRLIKVELENKKIKHENRQLMEIQGLIESAGYHGLPIKRRTARWPRWFTAAVSSTNAKYITVEPIIEWQLK